MITNCTKCNATFDLDSQYICDPPDPILCPICAETHHKKKKRKVKRINQEIILWSIVFVLSAIIGIFTILIWMS